MKNSKLKSALQKVQTKGALQQINKGALVNLNGGVCNKPNQEPPLPTGSCWCKGIYIRHGVN